MRPQKATIVGLIFIILALYSIVMAVVMTILASSLLGPLGGGVSVILWICIAPFILLYILAGYGILQGKHWGWVLGVVFGLLGILGGISSLAQGNYYSAISLLLSIIVVYLLFQDEVKEWCGE
ncbi:MAG: hypothetical protein J7L88_00080 [Thermoplasmata archaeon]|nr:hypothetical protein [Thermoplasmata archaeon]